MSVQPGFIAAPCGILDMAGNEKAAVVTKVVLLASRVDIQHMQSTFYNLLRAWPYLAGRLRTGIGKGKHKEFWTVHVPTADKIEELIKADQRGHFAYRRAVPMFSYLERADESLYDVIPFAYHARHPDRLPQDRPTIATIDRVALLKDFTSPHGVKAMDHYFSRDASLFTAHVINFRDGAGFTFTVPHACFDGAGAKAALEAYLCLLRGEPIGECAPIGYDPFARFAPSPAALSEKTAALDRQAGASSPSQTLVNQSTAAAQAPPPQPATWRILSLWQILLLVFNVAWDYFIDRPERKMSRVMIYVPPRFVDDLKEEVRKDVKAEQGVEKYNEARLSRANALHAWVMKNELARRVDVKPDRITCHGTLANMRFRLPNGLPSIHPNFTGNCLMPIVTPVTTTRELANQSLGAIAYQIRKSLLEQSTPQEIERYVRWQMWRGTPAAAGGGLEQTGMAVFFPPTCRFTLVTDWTKFGLWELDWSGALAKAETPSTAMLTPDTRKEGSDSSSTMTAAHSGEKHGMLALIGDAHLALHQRNGWILVGGRDGECWIMGNISDKERVHPRGWGQYEDIVYAAEA